MSADDDDDAVDVGPHRTLRPPAVAGTFYPAGAAECRRAAQSLMRDVSVDSETTDAQSHRWIGAVVPHAGWVCSGAIAAQAIAALAKSNPAATAAAPDVVVVFGAVHTPAHVDFAALDAHDAWQTPGDETALATELSRDLVGASGATGLFAVESRLHRYEHAVEVELPLVREAWPAAALLPIEVPPIDDAVEIGRRTAAQLAKSGLRAVYLASSDLTHYGPSYRFTPAGVGVAALAWAKGNDRRLLERVTALDAESLVPEARAHQNACGPGAIAAMLAACREAGSASAARLLRHANSYETLARVAPQQPADAVGYAAVVVG